MTVRLMTVPRKVDAMLPGVLRSLGIGRNPAIPRLSAALDEALAEVMPRLGREGARVTGFRAGDLTVEVDSSPLMAELATFHAEVLAQAINRHLAVDAGSTPGGPKLAVRRIRFRLKGMGHV